MNTAISITPPPDFPVTWPQPEDAQYYWTRDHEHTPEPMTPLYFSVAGLIHREARRRTLPAYDEAVLEIWGRRINTYCYTHLVTFTGTPDETRARAQRNRARVSATSLRLGELWREEWEPELKQHFAFWETFDLANAAWPALRAHVVESIERATRLNELHYLFGPPMWYALHEFENLYCDLFTGRTPLDAHRLLQGFDNQTLQMGRALWQLSRSARGNPSVRNVLRAQPAAAVWTVLEQFGAGRAFLRELQAFLEACGHRSNLWDWGYPSWADDPTPVINNLKNYLAQPDRDFEAERRASECDREQCIAVARRELSNYPQPVRARFEQWLAAAQEALVLTENHTYYLDFNGYGHVHRVMRECGRRLAQQGRLTCADDVFYLELGELDQLFDQPALDLRSVAMARRAEVNYWAQVAEPLELGMRPAHVARLYSPDARRMQRYMGAQLAEEAETPMADGVLHGQAGSSGKVRGPARVIRSLAEAQRLKTGDILVTTTTAPSWTPFFLTAAAVVTDTGGLLSHGAIVAREYHIPAVVGTCWATTRIVDGQWIEVDGSSGEVTLL